MNPTTLCHRALDSILFSFIKNQNLLHWQFFKLLLISHFNKFNLRELKGFFDIWEEWFSLGLILFKMFQFNFEATGFSKHTHAHTIQIHDWNNQKYIQTGIYIHRHTHDTHALKETHWQIKIMPHGHKCKQLCIYVHEFKQLKQINI